MIRCFVVRSIDKQSNFEQKAWAAVQVNMFQTLLSKKIVRESLCLSKAAAVLAVPVLAVRGAVVAVLIVRLAC